MEGDAQRVSELIRVLKEEHERLGNLLMEVRTFGIGSREGKEKLLGVKSALLGHLERENQRLYPILRRAAERDPDIKRTLELFAANLEEVTGVAMGFFETYGAGSSGLNFAKDFGRLFALLGDRIRKEETVLFPLYEKVSG